MKNIGDKSLTATINGLTATVNIALNSNLYSISGIYDWNTQLDEYWLKISFNAHNFYFSYGETKKENVVAVSHDRKTTETE